MAIVCRAGSILGDRFEDVGIFFAGISFCHGIDVFGFFAPERGISLERIGADDVRWVFGELSFAEIAEIFGRTESWARVTYHRAKLKIRERMD